jgi:hypothetical protein
MYLQGVCIERDMSRLQFGKSIEKCGIGSHSAPTHVEFNVGVYISLNFIIQVIIAIVGYMLCSSLMLIANKLVG